MFALINEAGQYFSVGSVQYVKLTDMAHASKWPCLDSVERVQLFLTLKGYSFAVIKLA